MAARTELAPEHVLCLKAAENGPRWLQQGAPQQGGARRDERAAEADPLVAIVGAYSGGSVGVAERQGARQAGASQPSMM